MVVSVCRNCNILMLKQAESGMNGLSGETGFPLSNTPEQGDET